MVRTLLDFQTVESQSHHFCSVNIYWGIFVGTFIFAADTGIDQFNLVIIYHNLSSCHVYVIMDVTSSRDIIIELYHMMNKELLGRFFPINPQ